jgi:DNA-binding transcriptional LysR family regulator
MLNPVWLRTLRAVVELGSFADAARRLGYTPSAVSQQMSRLERSIDTPLFLRDRRGMIPTSAAIRLAERAAGLLDLLADLDQADVTENDKTNLRIGICSGGLQYARPALGRLVADDARVLLSTASGESTKLVDEIVRGILDAAIVCRYQVVPRIWPSQIVSWPLADELPAVLLPVTHPAAYHRSVALADVRDEWWVTGPETNDESVCLRLSCAAAGFQPRVAARVHDRCMAMELVSNGFGISLVSGTDLPDMPAGVVAVPLAGHAFRRIEVVHATSAVSAVTMTFVANLRHSVVSRLPVSASQDTSSVFDMPTGEGPSMDGVAR